MSLNAQIVDYLEAAPGSEYTTAELAAALGIESKKVSSALSKLVKAGKVTRHEDGRVTANSYAEETPTADSSPEEEDLIGDISAPSGPEGIPTETFKPGDKTVDIAKWKKRITALLAKAERTDNEEERDAFTKAAEKFMLRLGIHRAELEATGEVKKDKIVEVAKVWKGNYSIAFLPFTHDVANGFGHLTVLQSTRNACHRTSFIIGPESEVKEFLVLLNSLELQVLSALRRWQRENAEERRYLTDMEKFIQHRSFITGFGSMVADRLFIARKGEEKEMSTGAELVVANRDTEVAEWISAQYPTLGKAKGGMRYGSAIGRQAGREAGRKATLNQKGVAGVKAVEK